MSDRYIGESLTLTSLPGGAATDAEVTAAINAHVAAADPHPGYLTQAEGDVRYTAADATLSALAGISTSADKLIYATGSDAFATTTLTSFARSLLDDADQAAAQATLGIGSLGTQSSGSVSITGGSISGTTVSEVYSSVSADTNASAGTSYLMDCSAAARLLTLPTSPSGGDRVVAQRVGQYFNAYLEPGAVKVNTGDAIIAAIDSNGTTVSCRYVDSSTGWASPSKDLKLFPSVTTLGLWLPDRGITTAGGSVSSWADYTGSLTASQGTAGAQPAHSSTGLNGLRPGLAFDGGDYLDAGRVVNSTGAFWLLVTLKMDSTSALQAIVAQDDTASARFWSLQYNNSSSAWQWLVYQSSTVWKGRSASDNTYLPGETHTFICTYDGGTGTNAVQLFVDGEEASTTSNNGTFNTGSSNANITMSIGSAYTSGSASRQLTGDIGLLAVGTGTLTATQRQQMFSFANTLAAMSRSARPGGLR